METTIDVTPVSNGLDSLDRVARDLEAADGNNPLTLKGALAWGWHTVGLLAYLRLQPHKSLFDAWVQDYLHEGDPELQVDRDAHWEERERLSFLELLDLLSVVEMPILKPEFYQGWQDRTARCHNLRQQVAGLVGGSVGEEQRQQLLLLLAAYHHLIRLPAGVELDAALIREAFPALLDLVALLLDDSAPQAEALQVTLNRCRQALR